jgi:hypothetical protein
MRGPTPDVIDAIPKIDSTPIASPKQGEAEMRTMFGKTAIGTIFAVAAGLVVASSADGRPGRQPPPRETSAKSRSSSFPEDQACLSAFRGAEASEQAGHLRAAKERLFLCGQPLCPRAIRNQCAVRYTQIEADIPSVVLVVQDNSGTPQSDIQVAADGEPLASHLDGRALPMDPGLHRFTFSKSGEVIARQSVMIAQGQRNRLVAVSLKADDAPVTTAAVTARLPATRAVMVSSVRPSSGKAESAGVDADDAVESRLPSSGSGRADLKKPSAPPALSLASMDDDAGQPRRPRTRRAHPALAAEPATGASPSSPASQVSTPAGAAVSSVDDGGSRMKVLAVALGSVGVASTVAGLLLLTWGRDDNGRLAECSPFCSESAVSHVHNMYLGADIAFGVGVVALAGATWAAFRSRAPAKPQGIDVAYHLEIRPSTAGAVALMRRAF